MTTPECRLCDGQTSHQFDRLILGKHAVAYFECLSCGSLETEQPYWLAEAYSIPGVHIDVGQAARVIQTWLRLCYILERIGFDSAAKCVDYGGSAGLLTRLMRDSGYCYFSFDLYDNSKYANYFRTQNLAHLGPSLISAFEVFEHLTNPRQTLGELLRAQPELVIFTTQFYERQGPDWPYLVPICGQHIFFYTTKALEQFSGSFGYELTNVCGFWVLARRDGRYVNAIKAFGSEGANLDVGFAGQHVMQVGWGTKFTALDGEYALDRFTRELDS
jgi:hypothetical protein